MKRAFGFVVLVLMVFAAVPVDAACQECRDSPNGWGFCRMAQDGYTYCKGEVADDFSGRTTCRVWGTCVSSGDGGFDDCEWTDINGECVYYY